MHKSSTIKRLWRALAVKLAAFFKHLIVQMKPVLWHHHSLTLLRIQSPRQFIRQRGFPAGWRARNRDQNTRRTRAKRLDAFG
jgi:hypothetical protein